jgi:phosphatidate cytidylyltransferase
MIPDKSLRTRLIVAAILIPLVSLFIFLGGGAFALFLGVFLALAVWEYWRMFRIGNYSPSLFLMVTGVLAAVAMRFFLGFEMMDLWLTVLVLLAMAFAVVQQTQSVPQAAFNFAITVSGVLYVGWLGGYALSLRNLPNGLFWTLLVIFAAAASDAGAYFVGVRFGKHKIAPVLSPKKSWEGYLGGVAVAAVSTWLVTLITARFFLPEILPLQGLVLGCALALLTPLGDLAESMLKRLFNLKDASHLLPGHGGILDRIDSSLWALPIGFYILLFLH